MNRSFFSMRASLSLLFLIPILVFSENVPTTVKKNETHDSNLFRKEDEVFFTNIEFLYWTIAEGALDYVIKTKRPASFNTMFAYGDMECSSFGWDPGFRVNIGYFNAPNYWEAVAQYTWLKVSKGNHIDKPDDPSRFLTGTWPHIFLAPMERAKYRIRNLYNVLDLVVNRVFHPNPHLRLRILGGLTGAFIGQKWKIDYLSGGSYSQIYNRWRFRGGGLKLGISFDWFWRKDFYLTGKTSFASLIGGYKNQARQITNTGVLGGSGLPVRDVTLTDARLTYTTMFSLGPSWQKNFECSRFEIFAGYEFTNWFNLQEVYRSTSGSPEEGKETWLNRGLFSLHGLTTRLTIDF